MFRYSRDVKRCGPGTKAGAPVGVVYCLSTSSFFILTLTLELDVSAFGIGYTLATYSRRSAGTDFGPVTASRIIAKSRALSRRRAKILPRWSRACSRPPSIRGCGVSGLLGLDGRPRFGKALAH